MDIDDEDDDWNIGTDMLVMGKNLGIAGEIKSYLRRCSSKMSCLFKLTGPRPFMSLTCVMA